MAQGYRNWAEETIGAVPSGTTPRFASDGSTTDFTVQEDLAADGSKAVRILTPGTGDRMLQVHSPASTEVERLVRFRTEENSISKTFMTHWLFVNETGGRNGYEVRLFQSSGGNWLIDWRKWEAGAVTQVTSTQVNVNTLFADWTANTWYGLRAKAVVVVDTTHLYARAWKWADVEPGTWTTSREAAGEPVFPAGDAGFGGSPGSTNASYVDFDSWGTDGDVAPTAALGGVARTPGVYSTVRMG